MAYTPRNADEILQSVAARVVARSELNDVSEGSVLLHVLASVAEELNIVELRLKTIRDSYSFTKSTGTDLDERVAELPPNGLKRRGSVNASGSVLAVTREDDNLADEITLFAGASFLRSDDPLQLYTTDENVIFPANVKTVSGISISAISAGSVGNCPAGSIDIIEADAAFISVNQTSPLTNGADEETDTQLRHRAKIYLRSLARCQPDALEYASLSFVAENGSRAIFAKCNEDPKVLGYSELLIDDGSGMENVTKPGALVSGDVTPSGQTLLWHEKPATTPMAMIGIYDTATNNLLKNLKSSNGDFVSIPERGLVYLKDPLVDGQTWKIETYDVYIGLIAELQQEIEGNAANPGEQPGWRAAGTRVRVIPPVLQFASMDIHVVPINKVALAQVAGETKTAIINYLATLSPGDPMYVASLYDRIMDNDNVSNVHLYEKDTNTPLSDVYPTTLRHVIRTQDTKLKVVPFVEEI